MSVGIGLNSLEQFIFLPCQTHFFRRYSDPGISSFLWQGGFECHSRLKRLLKFLPISFTGKLACMISFKIFSICWKSFLLFLFRNKSIIGNLVFVPWSFDVLLVVFVWDWHELSLICSNPNSKIKTFILMELNSFLSLTVLKISYANICWGIEGAKSVPHYYIMYFL